MADTMPAKWVPIKEYPWDEKFDGGLKTVTCRYHPTARYLTKHPRIRSLHFVQAPDPAHPFTECKCPYSDLVVVIGEEE